MKRSGRTMVELAADLRSSDERTRDRARRELEAAIRRALATPRVRDDLTSLRRYRPEWMLAALERADAVATLARKYGIQDDTPIDVAFGRIAEPAREETIDRVLNNRRSARRPRKGRGALPAQDVLLREFDALSGTDSQRYAKLAEKYPAADESGIRKKIERARKHSRT